MSGIRDYFHNVSNHPVRFIIALPFIILEWMLGIPWLIVVITKQWDILVLLIFITIIVDCISNFIFPQK